MQCNDWPDKRCFTPLVITSRCHTTHRSACLCMRRRILRCFDQGDSLLYKQQGVQLTSHFEKNATDYPQGTKPRNNLHSSSFPFLHLLKKHIAQNLKSHSFSPNHLIFTGYGVPTSNHFSNQLPPHRHHHHHHHHRPIGGARCSQLTEPLECHSQREADHDGAEEGRVTQLQKQTTYLFNRCVPVVV